MIIFTLADFGLLLCFLRHLETTSYTTWVKESSGGGKFLSEILSKPWGVCLSSSVNSVDKELEADQKSWYIPVLDHYNILYKPQDQCKFQGLPKTNCNCTHTT